MEKRTVKVFVFGVVTGAIILVSINYYAGSILKKTDNNFKDEFPKPKFVQSFSDTKEVQQYTFDFYGKEMKIQGESVKIYTFDKEGNMHVREGETVRVPVEDNDYLLDEYVSQREAEVYKILKIKDKIKDQYSVYLTFNMMEKLYEEYLNRKPFDTLENRKEAIYKVFYDYMVSGQSYTMGGYKFSDLEKTIQKDLLELLKKINYMRENSMPKEESKFGQIIDQKVKDIKYKIFKIGRE